jgi:hypothetical protein
VEALPLGLGARAAPCPAGDSMRCVSSAMLALPVVPAVATVAPATTPPRGWRSFNCFTRYINQQLILEQVHVAPCPRCSSWASSASASTAGGWPAAPV